MYLLSILLVALFYGLSDAARPVKRASLTQISNFGDNPAGIKLWIYVPARVVSSPGIVFSLHGASGNAQQQFSSTPYATLAEQYGFIAVYPESPQGAWDATSAKSTVHDGGGASQSIANMATYIVNTYKANPAKIYASGISSGGTMAVRHYDCQRLFLCLIVAVHSRGDIPQHIQKHHCLFGRI